MESFDPPASSPAKVTVYGTSWCAGTRLVRAYLDRLGILYEYRDMDQDPGAERQVRWWTGGDASHPTLKVEGEILIEPRNSDVQLVLARHGLL